MCYNSDCNLFLCIVGCLFGIGLTLGVAPFAMHYERVAALRQVPLTCWPYETAITAPNTCLYLARCTQAADPANPQSAVNALFDNDGVCGLQLNNATYPFAMPLAARVCPAMWTPGAVVSYTANQVSCQTVQQLMGGLVTLPIIGGSTLTFSIVMMVLLCMRNC